MKVSFLISQYSNLENKTWTLLTSYNGTTQTTKTVSDLSKFKEIMIVHNSSSHCTSSTYPMSYFSESTARYYYSSISEASLTQWTQVQYVNNTSIKIKSGDSGTGYVYAK